MGTRDRLAPPAHTPLAKPDLAQDGHFKEGFERHEVGRGDKAVFRQNSYRLGNDDPGAGDAALEDGADGEKSVIDGSKTIGHHNCDREAGVSSQIADEVFAGNRHEPAANALDDDLRVLSARA